nr:hypothetical protein [Tanacetum cinerariifolium]
ALTGSKAKPDRSKFKVISYKENTDWKKKSPFHFSSDEESSDADTKGVNNKAESSQATPKAQSSQAKALRPNVIVGLASQYKNLATNCVEMKFGTRNVAEGSKSKGKRKVGEEWAEFVNDMTTDAYKIENKEIEGDEEPPRSIMWLKGRVKKTKNFQMMRLDQWEINLKRGGYTRRVRSEVTYKRYFDLPRSRQATDKRIELLQTQLDNEISGRQQKDVLVKKLSTEMTEKDVLVKKLSNEMTKTKEMLSQLMNQLAAQEVQLNLSSQLQVASDVTLMAINNIDSSAYEVDGTQSSVFVRNKDTRIQKKSNGLVTSEKEPVKTVGPKKMPKSRRNESPDSQSQGNVSPTQELPKAFKCKLWHLKKSNIVALGTVYKSDGKEMLHNQALTNDCYKVSIDSSLVDAACIPDVGNNRLKTVKDGVGGFFAWPKNQVVLDEEISDNNSASKLQSKRKNYVSRETMQRQARTANSQESLNYGS